MRIRTRIAIGTGVAIAFVIALSGVSFFGAREFVRTTRLVDEANVVIEAADDTLTDMVDIEAGARGYVITGEERFLEPYQRGLADVGDDVARLRAHRDRVVAAALPRLEAAIAHRLDISRVHVAVRRQRGLEAAVALVRTGTGKAAMDEVRAILDEIRTGERALLAERTAEARQRAASAIALIVGGGLAMTALLLVATRLLSRSLTRPLAELADRAARLDGERDVAFPAETRRDEIGALARSLAEMTRRRAAAEARQRMLLDSAVDPFFLADLEGRYLDVNHAACELLGYTREELLAKTIVDLLPPEDAPRLAAAREHLLTPGNVETGEWRLRARDGSYIPTEISARILPDGRWQAFARDLRERKRREAALRESEERFRLALDGAPIGMALVGLDGRFLRVNAALCGIVGYAADELTGLTFQMITHPDDVAGDLALAEQLRNGALQTYRLEKRYVRKDGSLVWVRLHGSIVRTGDGAPLYYIAQVEDLTDDKRAAAERERLSAEVAAERQYLQAVLDTVPVAVILFKPGGRLYANKKFEEIFGFPVAVDGGREQYQPRVFFPDGRPVSRDELASSRVLRTGQPIVGEQYLIERVDGTRVTIVGSAAAIRDDAGSVVGGVGMFQDMTERLRADAAIRRSEALLRAIVEILPVGIWIADADGRFVRHNRAAVDIFGRVRRGEEDLDQYAAWWTDSGDRLGRDDWPLVRALRHGEPTVSRLMTIEVEPGVRKTVLNSALPLRDEQGAITGAVVVHDDVTPLQRAEEALRRSVASRDEVLRVVAHDLRNPLNGILLKAQLLKPGADAEALGAGIRRAGKRMNRLIQDLLDVARIEDGALSLAHERVEVDALLTDLVASQAHAATAAELELVVEGAAAQTVAGDRDRLTQVLENLVGNAMKFTPAGGRISVGARREGRETLFWVRDTGPGLPPDSAAHLFDRFWQANRHDKRGAGLGLAIVRGIVEALGGRVWAESTPGAGTTFYFTVPAFEQQALHAPGA